MNRIESRIVDDLQHYLQKKEEDKEQNIGSWEPIDDKRKFVPFDLAVPLLCIKQ